MNHFDHIQQKLHGFIKKYYTGEIIKGSILFLSFGLLYFIFTLFIEYFLWLTPFYRMILFWLFIFVEIVLLIRFILIPLARLYGFKEGLTPEQASKIIGEHFHEIDDKLLNILQLAKEKEQTDLLLAGIEQKSLQLQPVPFKKAINFKTNIKYLKYLVIPLLIWLLTFLSGGNSIFTQSLNRVVHYNVAYEPPAPFHFLIANQNLKVIEGKPYDLIIKTIGDIKPDLVKIHFDNDETYLMNSGANATFSFHIAQVEHPINFYMQAGNIRSKSYTINPIATPRILDFTMQIDYPKYTLKEDEIIRNTGNITVPAGTIITWNIKTRSASQVSFKVSKSTNLFKRKDSDYFTFSQQVLRPLSYQISTSNSNLKEYEKLNYHIDVIQDEFPEIKVKSDIDTLQRGDAHFSLIMNDDYAISKLQMIYTLNGSKDFNTINIPVNHASFAEVFYTFPDTLNLKSGETYQLYFKVFDNDAVSGYKSTRSQTFFYNQLTEFQKADAILKEQQESLKQFGKTKIEQEKLQEDLEKFSKKLKSTEKLNWNDQNDIDQFFKRQKQYKKMMEHHSNQLLENLKEFPVNQNDASLKDKKEALQKRLEELKQIEKNDQLLKELEELSKKLQKENLIDQLDRLTEKNKQQNRSLERILEMVKQFYTEMKANQIVKKLDSLSFQQQQLSKQTFKNTLKDQQKLNSQFDSIKKDFKELEKQNKALRNPLKFPKTQKDQEIITKEMENATEKLKEQEQSKSSKSPSKNQQNASQQMKSLSDKLNKSLQSMSGEMISENIRDIENILKNLLNFSFDQERLMISLEDVDASHAEFPQKLKQQQNLKVYFEHIDDSLYALSFRLVKLSAKIQTDLTNAHYNLNKSLENLSEDQIKNAMTNQHYTMTAANNLADLLSDLLESLKNPKLGRGKGKSSQSISLPDIIKKQKKLSQKMKEGLQKSKSSQKNKEAMSGELYQIYKEQSALKKLLQEMLKQTNGNTSAGSKAVKQMEDLEKALLKNGFDQQILKKIKDLDYELLKLDNAHREQGKDSKRQSKTANPIQSLKTNKVPDQQRLYFNNDDILIRKTIPLQPFYQRKVNQFFKK